MVTASQEIQAKIEGDISGQVAVGTHILQIGNVNGGLVYIATASDQLAPEPRVRPVLMKPRAFPDMLDREMETDTIRSALVSLSPVSLFGSGGSGKTSLLRRTAHLSETDRFQDGVIYLQVKGMGLEDLLQFLFDTFYSSLPGTKQNDGELRYGLHGVRGLILLDDLSLPREEVDSLLNVMPESVFVFASQNRSLWGQGQAIQLRGLPDSEAILLFEREWGQRLTDMEIRLVRDIAARLEDHPQRIVNLAGFLQDSGGTVARLQELLKENDPDLSTARLSVAALGEPLKKILAVLAAANGGVMPLEHLAALVQIDRLQEALDTLLALDLIQAHSPRYSLTGVMSASLPRLWKLDGVEERLLEYFSGWLGQQPTQEQVQESQDILWQLTQRAVLKERWREVIQLGRALEAVFIVGKRWQAWSDLLQLILNAARMLHDRSQEAWALHQLGTRFLCLGATEQARNLLSEAFNIRKSIGDEAGLAVTRHNLEVLRKASITKIKKGKGPGPGHNLGFISLSIILLLAVIGVGSVFAASNSGSSQASADTPTSTVVPASTFTSTVEPGPTSVIPSMTSVVLPPSQTPVAPSPTGTNTLTSTQTNPPTITPTNTPTPTPTVTVTSIPCYLAQFVKDMTIPDGTNLAAGTPFTKTWRLKNEGSCSWDQSYQIIFVRGDLMSDSQIFQWTAGIVKPGETADVSVDLVAPYSPDTYQAYLMLLTPGGTYVGLGSENKPFWVNITIPAVTDILVDPEPSQPDTVLPAAPEGLDPDFEAQIYCKMNDGQLSLQWKEPYDESGIKGYEVVVESAPIDGFVDPGKKVYQTDAPWVVIPIDCGFAYKWYVSAIDGAGNQGLESQPASFYAVDNSPG